MSDFVHLHNHSDFSLQDGAQTVEMLCNRCDDLGMDSIALTEHGNLFSMIPFYKEAKKKGLDFKNFENYWISAVGETLYNKFVKEYSKKMWSIDSNQLLSADFKWINRGTPIRDGDLRLFGDQYQGYPYVITGYNDYFIKSLNIKPFNEKKNTS